MSISNKSGASRLLDPANGELSGQMRVNAEIFTAVEILGRKLERSETERDRLARRLALIESAATVDEKTGKLYLPVVMDPAMQPRMEYATPKWMVSASLMSSAIALFALGLVLFREPAPLLTKEQLAALDSLKGAQFASLSLDSKGWQYPEQAFAPQPEEITAPAVTTASATSPSAVLPATLPEAQISPAAGAPALPETAAETLPETTGASAPPETAEAPALPETTGAPLPDATELSRLEQTAVAPAPVETPVAPAPAPVAAAPEAVKPENVLIPGEDKIAEKPVEKPATPSASAPIPLVAQKAEKPAAAPAPAVKKAEPAAVAKAVPAAEKPVAAAAPQDISAAPDMPPDPALPAKLAQLEKRAYEGVPEAQHDLATLYASGKLVAQNFERTIYWFTKSADNGVANANYNLGVIYHQGLGTPVDMQKALSWYERAAELGHPEAMYNLGIAYIEGIGTAVNIDKGVSFFKRASAAGVAQAAYNLGVLYESNFIGKIDTDKALEWYETAANGGHAEARTAVNRLKGLADAGDVSNDQALSLADMVEPAAGEEQGEGDSSPVNEGNPLAAQKNILLGLQQELINQGLLPGQPTGVMNQQTEDAIRSYQKRLGLPENGVPTQELLDRVRHAAPVQR